MRIGVGSSNPVKREAVVTAVGDATLDDDSPSTIEAIPVETGVSEQPRGHAETIRGARTRARNVVANGYDLGVGLEGGVAEFEGVEGLFVIMWAVVDDGTTIGSGSGPSVRLPVEIERRVRNGEELGPVINDVLGEDDVATGRGAIGVFTAGRVDREDALAVAVSSALAPFLTDRYEANDRPEG
ncbi:DUF84 family protein [Halopenitus sp. H-Gu1]|uniref:DUF84 family protein n=1 Tax=Halopenitus sp. H-Gu1 TaxID=3242697 RepID=UPI00359E8FC3